ncbi:helix-turn-helix domain-containing protein [Burkholderia sp. Ax-1724]|uniref:helix-turn-helix domain-containing protein n=1 Tax=Burkholderia sp. Ax-1724 TaxID=2608336 RepID=UPI00142169D1|nr:helix-turn-helix domain-containing protein [Burkholderia sp. Ax-1724]NIF55059.1 helix-turn-helix domain-containing protein [Burkholderia sp. Ax-1724]
MNRATMPATRRWSTDAVSPRERLDYWREAVCEGFLEMTVDASASSFHGTLESAPLEGIGINRVRSSTQHVYRTARAISRARENYFYLLCKTDFAWFAEQDSHRAALQPGDLLLVDSRRSYAFHLMSSADTLSLELPTAWVERWLPRPGDHVARRIDGHRGWGSVLSRFACELTPEMAMRPPLPARLLADQLGALLALACDSHGPAVAPAAAELRARVLDAIRERHTEPRVTAQELAEGLGISERSLHRCLAGTGTTFASALLENRLATAKALLEQARFDRLTIAEVGYRAGFADPSHFARVCRRHLGATPQALRRQFR